MVSAGSGQPTECQIEARLVLLLGDLPELLDAEREGLRRRALAQPVALHQPLGERAAAALGEQRVGGAKLHPGLVVRALLAVPLDAGDAGHHAPHLPVLDDQVGGGEARVDLDAEFLRLGPEPAADIAERDDVVALVVHGARVGRRTARVAVRYMKRSSVAGVVSSGMSSRQSGSSSSSARGSITAPERMWAPISPPFSDQAHRRLGRELLELDGRSQARRGRRPPPARRTPLPRAVPPRTSVGPSLFSIGRVAPSEV